MKSTNNEIELNDLSVIANMKIFQQLLADELVLYAKTLGASSKVMVFKSEDENFYYKKFKILEKVLIIVNNQIRKLNFNSQGTLTDGLKNSKLKEFDSNTCDSEDFIRNLLDDNDLIIKSICKCLKDDFIYLNSNDSLNLIAEILQLHIEMTWILRDLLIQINYSK